MVEVFLFVRKRVFCRLFCEISHEQETSFPSITEVLIAVKWTKIILAEQSKKRLDFEIKKISEIMGYSFMDRVNCGTISNRCTHNL